MFKDSVCIAASLMITGLVIFLICATGCATGTEEDMTEKTMTDYSESSGEELILILAQTAASSHNSQPWALRKEAEGIFLVKAVPERSLRYVDPDKREYLLSLGAYLENLRIAAESYGYHAEIDVLMKDAADADLARVTLSDRHGVVDNERIMLMRSASMAKVKYRKSLDRMELLSDLLEGQGDMIWIGRNDPVYSFIQKGTVEANRQQAWKDETQYELADYICFSQTDEDSGVGMTPKMLGLPWFMSGSWYKKADRESVMSRMFRNGGAGKAEMLMKHCAGVILITSPDSTVRSLLDCGGRFQRLYWECKESGIELHTVSQILEESPWREELPDVLGVYKPVQFVLRAGITGKKQTAPDVLSSASIRIPVKVDSAQ